MVNQKLRSFLLFAMLVTAVVLGLCFAPMSSETVFCNGVVSAVAFAEPAASSGLSNITLKPNYEAADGLVVATVGEELPAFTALTRGGYTLLGYYTLAIGGQPVINAQGELLPDVSGYTDSSAYWAKDSATELYAHWQAKEYTITLLAGARGWYTSAVSTRYTADAAVSPLLGIAEPEAERGYKPDGWVVSAATDSNQTVGADFEWVQGCYGNLTLTAQYAPIGRSLFVTVSGAELLSADSMYTFDNGIYKYKYALSVETHYLDVSFGKLKGFDLPQRFSVKIGGEEVSDDFFSYQSNHFLNTCGMVFFEGDISGDIEIVLHGTVGRLYWYDEGIRATAFSNKDEISKTLQINSAAELGLFAYNMLDVNSDLYCYPYTVSLAADLDLSLHYWLPIALAFGSFDGKGFIINGIKIQPQMEQACCGFFSYIEASYGSVNNLRLSGIVEGNTFDNAMVGGLAGEIRNSAVYANLAVGMDFDLICEGSANVGGLAGASNAGAEFINSSAYGQLSLSVNDVPVCIGGLAGQYSNGDITNCYFGGSISVSGAGVIGELVGKATTVEINNCYVLHTPFFGEADSITQTSSATVTESQLTAMQGEGALLGRLNDWVALQNSPDNYSWFIFEGLDGNVPCPRKPFAEYTINAVSGIHGSFILPQSVSSNNFTVTAPGVVLPECDVGYSFTEWLVTAAEVGSDWEIGDSYVWQYGKQGNITITAAYIISAPEISNENGYSAVYDKQGHNISISASHALEETYSLSYAWYKGEVKAENLVNGADGAAISVKNVSDSDTYYCKVSISDGDSNYSISCAITVAITAAQLPEISAIASVEYDGQVHTPILSIAGTVENTDYTLQWSATDFCAAAQYVATATGKGNYQGTRTKTYAITPLSINNATVALGGDLIYTGQAQTKDVLSVRAGTLLATYTVSGNIQTNVGTQDYVLTISGNGNYCGTLTRGWNIQPKNIEGAIVALGAAKVYNGMPQTLVPSQVSINGLAVDYDISGNVKTEAGGYSLTITGKGNFCGNVTKEWSISRKSIQDAIVTLGATLIYNGKAQTQTVAEVSAGGISAVYSVENNVQTQVSDGGYTMLIKGTGNFCGEIQKQWNILPQSIQGAVITTGAQLTYNGMPQTLEITAVSVAGLDATYTVSGNTQTDVCATEYQLVIKGTGNFCGTVEKPWNILPKNIAGGIVALEPEQTFNGAAQTRVVTSVTVDNLSATFTTEGDTQTHANNGYIMTINGCGNFSGKLNCLWNIAKRDISQAVIVKGPAPIYSGQPLTQSVQSVLTQGDLLATFVTEGNIQTEIGITDYVLTISGTGDFCGSASCYWNIVKRSINGATIQKGEALVYNGKPQIQTVQSVTVDTISATFKVECQPKTDVGEGYKLIVKGTGSFEGEQEVEYSIAKMDISNAKVVMGNPLYYNGTLQEQTVSQVIAGGLNATFTVENNRQTVVGEQPYTLLISGTGNFSGTLQKPWNIQKGFYNMKDVVFEGLTVIEDGLVHSLCATNIPQGITVEYDGNGKIMHGTYLVTAKFTGDSQNYLPIADKKAILVINQQIVTGVSDGKGQREAVIISCEEGFSPDIEISVTGLEDAEFIRNSMEERSLVYDIKLMRGEEVVQPNSVLTIKLKVPESFRTEEFKLLREGDGGSYVEMTYYIDENGFAVVKTNKLTKFAFVKQQDFFIGMYVILGVVIILAVVLVVVKLNRDKRFINKLLK